jgi:hypothetical protein
VCESLDPSFIVSSFWGTLSVRLVVERTIIIIVPLIVSFLFHSVALLMTVFYPATCISFAENVAHVPLVLISLSTVLL